MRMIAARFLAFLLIPCLTIDPSLTALFKPSACLDRPSSLTQVIEAEAVVARLRHFLREPGLDSDHLGAAQMRAENKSRRGGGTRTSRMTFKSRSTPRPSPSKTWLGRATVGFVTVALVITA
jgi:hypothetical protein